MSKLDVVRFWREMGLVGLKGEVWERIPLFRLAAITDLRKEGYPFLHKDRPKVLDHKRLSSSFS